MRDKLTETEKMMYSIMNALSSLPIVFKGSMITALVLKDRGFDTFHRETVDIAADWIGTKEDMNVLCESLNKALSSLNIQVEAFREYGDKTSAGFKFYSGDELITKMDMDVGRKIADKQEFSIYEYSFSGITPDQIITEKLCAISTEKVFRRIKDIIDLYALGSCSHFRIDDIYDILDKTERSFGDFNAFLSGEEGLSQAYDKMKRMDYKPSFRDIYGLVRDIVLPVSRNEQNMSWDKNGWILLKSWDDIKDSL